MRTDPARFRGRFYPNGPYPCLDGWVHTIIQPPDWKAFCIAIGKEEWLSDPRFNNAFDLSLVSEVDGTFIGWLMERTKQEASEELQAKNTICTPFNTPADIFNDRHFKERGFWVEIDHPEAAN